MVQLTRRNLLASSVAAAVGAGAAGTATADDEDTPGAPTIRGRIDRLATTALGAEVTGPFVFENGEFLFSLQHPSGRNPAPYDTAGIGWYRGHQFEFDGRNDEFEDLEPPRTEAEQGEVRVSGGEYEVLAQDGDPIDGGEQEWGHPETPDGTPIREFAGSRYGAMGHDPDMNFFVPTDDAGLEGYLFTNVESSPGSVVRTPLERTEDGWEADLENATNLENTEAFRELGGTRINCYGDLSPWDTPMSAEEDYVHPRVNYTSTVGDIVEAGSGVGLRGAAQFFNRPNPTDVGDNLDEIFGADSWGPQGSWALGGLELLAYYLGADPVDQVEGENTIEPLGEGYPNPYRTGYIVEITEPTAEEPVPVKHWAMGRAAWECPEFLPDERTVYLSSDGANKGVYKFVAEEPIPSYDDRMDVTGTLYAPEIVNEEAAKDLPPAEVDLEIEWIELGTASNREVESWIAEYDDVTQVDYLETHADTDWEEDLEQALLEADETVAIEGNQDYITDEEVVEWAEQYEERGPDGVDEELRRVPFLETRAAAKEIGASIEFRKAEGIHAHDEAEPGDFLYLGISEVNDGLSDDDGDVRLERVDGGMVYRARLDANYDVSTLEPVVVGADATDPPNVIDYAPINVDNVMVMDDGRVLLCEDASQLGRSFPNDSLWVYEPPAVVEVEGAMISSGASADVELTADKLPRGLAGGRVSVSIEHASVAAIDDVTLADWVDLAAEPEFAEDGSAVELRVADLEDDVGTGSSDVTLATLELDARGTGTTDVTVDVHALDDDEGDAIEAQGRPSVVMVGPPPVGGGPGGGRSPRDRDGDGLYEDVNGNGRLDYDDVVTLFEHVEEDAVVTNPGAFDFNDNGRVDYDDVVALYEQL